MPDTFPKQVKLADIEDKVHKKQKNERLFAFPELLFLTDPARETYRQFRLSFFRRKERRRLSRATSVVPSSETGDG